MQIGTQGETQSEHLSGDTQQNDIRHRQLINELIMSMMGVDRFAYIRPDEEAGFAVYAADGTPLAVFDSMDEAFFSIRRHNLTPVNLH